MPTKQLNLLYQNDTFDVYPKQKVIHIMYIFKPTKYIEGQHER